MPAKHRVAHRGGGSGAAGVGSERTVSAVPRAFWCVHSAPQPLPSRLWTAWAAERGHSQSSRGLGGLKKVRLLSDRLRAAFSVDTFYT